MADASGSPAVSPVPEGQSKRVGTAADIAADTASAYQSAANEQRDPADHPEAEEAPAAAAAAAPGAAAGAAAASDSAGSAPTPGSAATATKAAPVIPALDFQIGAVVVGTSRGAGAWVGSVTTRYEPSFATAIGGEAGDSVAVVSATDAEWWTVRNERTGEQGFMPASMIDISAETEDAMVKAGATIARRSPHASAGQDSSKKGFSKLTRLGKARVAKVVESTADLASSCESQSL